MSYSKTISAILKGHWAILPSWAEAHLSVVLNILQGKPVSFSDRTGNESVEKPFIIEPASMTRREMNSANVAPNSVGVMPISGPIMKYNGDCGEPGMIQRSAWLGQMERQANIGSVVLLMDTPGGEARATEGFATSIQKMSKPVLSFTDGMTASAGMFYSSASDEVWLSGQSDEMGSIGSYIMLADFAGYFEKQGLKIHEIYAPQSVDKNREYRDALKGDYGPMEDYLKSHVDSFISFVSQTRGDKAKANQKAWSSGKMFPAKEAINIGLADRIGSFEQAVSKAAWLGKRNK